jgi:hypothetical protein
MSVDDNNPRQRQRQPKPDQSHQLFITDGEIAKRVGLSFAEWVMIAGALEKSGLPLPDPLFKNRRYWPAVRLYLDRRAGIRQDNSPLVRDGEENWNGRYGRKSRTGT